MHRKTLTVETKGRGTYDIGRDASQFLEEIGYTDGLLNIFVQHTSASLILCENADPSVRRDLERVFGRLAPDGDPIYEHDAEGPDDMAAHVRSILTTSSLSVPVAGGRPMLGTWQGIYLWEHRTAPHRRRVVFTWLHGAN